MNKRLKFIVFMMVIPTIVLLFIYSYGQRENNSIQLLKTVSFHDAKRAISQQYLDHKAIKKTNYDSTQIYVVAKIDIVNNNSALFPLMIKGGHPIYIFQNKHLIYSQDENKYYQGNSIQDTNYNLKIGEQWKEQTLHQIPLYSQEPLYILIKKAKAKAITDFIEIPGLINQKNIDSLKHSNTAILKINTHKKGIDTVNYQFASIEIIYNNRNHKLLSKIKIRGNSSVVFPKKKFNIIFEEESALNGVKIKKNVLIGSYIDKSLLRNKLSENLFALLRDQKPSTTYSHVIINDNYQGLYLLSEHPEKQFENLITNKGGLNFLIQLDRGPFDLYGNKTSLGYKYEYPDSMHPEAISALNWFEQNISLEESRATDPLNSKFDKNIGLEGSQATDPLNSRINYLKNLFGLKNDIAQSIVEKADYILLDSNSNWTKSVQEKAMKNGISFYHQALKDSYWLLYGSAGKNTDLYFEPYKIDIPSFIDLVIINELSKNIDAYRLSTFISFVNNVFQINIVWDFDLSWGLSKYSEGFKPEGFVLEGENKQYIPFLWHELWENESFQTKLKHRYTELRSGLLSNQSIDSIINENYHLLRPSVKENFEKWQILGLELWPNKFTFATHEEEVEYLKSWTLKRLQWLDLQWHIKDN